MATIRKRNKDGLQWQVVIRRKGIKPIYKTFLSKADAEKFARKKEREIDKGEWQETSKADSTTLKECMERYLAEITPRKKGAHQEEMRSRIIIRDDMVHKMMSKVSGQDIALFRDSQTTEGKSPTTIVKYLALLSHVFNTARREWGMETLANPVELVNKPKVTRSRERRLEPDEEQKVFEALGDKPLLVAMAKLAIETAMRQGEISNLEWKHIDLNCRVVHLPKTKNGEARDVPLSTAAAKELRNWPQSIDGKVFHIPPASGNNWITCNFSRRMKKAKIENLRFHDLRHEATSRLANIFEAHELAKITGHKTLQMVMKYYHPRAADLAKRLA